MSLLDKHLENLFGSVAALMGAVMAQAAFYAASRQLGDFMFPLTALVLTGLVVTACRIASDRGTAIVITGVVSSLLLSVFVGFSGKVRQIFFDVTEPFPFQLGWADVFLAIVAPFCIAAIALAWRFHRTASAVVDQEDMAQA